MNWAEIIMIPAMIIVFIIFFPVINHFIGILFPVLDTVNPDQVFFVGLIKLAIGLIPFAIIGGFLWRIVKAVTEPSHPQYPQSPPIY